MSRITRSTLIVAFFFSIDKVMGLVRQWLFARTFSAGDLDIFFTSINIPDLLSALISGGALGMALIPVLAEYLEREGRPQAWQLFARILNLAFLVTGALALVIIVAAAPLIQYLIAPGFEPAKQAMTVELMRLDLLAILIFSISGLAMAGLQANQHFLLPAMAPLLYNLGQIFGAGYLAPAGPLEFGGVALPVEGLGLGLHGLVFGVILGALLHLGIQVPGLLYYGFRWAPRLDLRHPGVQKVLRLMGPRVLSMAFLHSYFLSRDNFASFLGEGAVSALNYGWFIQQVPETLIGTAIAIVLLPSLSEHIARGDHQAFSQTINRALRAMLALSLPAAALLGVGLKPLFVLVFSNFGPVDMAVWATRAFLLGLLGHAWLEVAVRSFYAHQNARVPMIAAGLQAVGFVGLAALLVRVWGTPGIALADSIVFTTQAVALLFLLNRRFAGVLRVGDTLVRALAAALLSGGIVYAAMQWAPLPELLSTLVGLALGALAALPLIWPEVKSLVRL